MKKETADKLAYEMAKARFVNSSQQPVNKASARSIAEFIQLLSAEFQTHLSDFESSVQGD